MSLSANRLDLTTIHTALHDCPIGHTVDYYPQVTSTMPYAHKRAADPATRSGTIIVADEQTAGRGRAQRRWTTPTGEALLLSIILKPPLPLANQQIPMVAGLAAMAAITAVVPSLQGRVGLKWPNDLLVGTGMADAGKVGGILVETQYYGSTPSHVIVGIGINLLQTADTLPPAPRGAPPPTSLALALAQLYPTNRPALPDRTALLVALCQAWTKLLFAETVQPQLQSQPQPQLPLAQILTRWRAALWTLGHPVVIHASAVQQTAGTSSGDVPQILCEGIATDVTPLGQLLIMEPSGAYRCFDAGDVSVRMG